MDGKEAEREVSRRRRIASWSAQLQSARSHRGVGRTSVLRWFTASVIACMGDESLVVCTCVFCGYSRGSAAVFRAGELAGAKINLNAPEDGRTATTRRARGGGAHDDDAVVGKWGTWYPAKTTLGSRWSCMRTVLPRVWSSFCTMKVPALAIVSRERELPDPVREHELLRARGLVHLARVSLASARTPGRQQSPVRAPRCEFTRSGVIAKIGSFPPQFLAAITVDRGSGSGPPHHRRDFPRAGSGVAAPHDVSSTGDVAFRPLEPRPASRSNIRRARRSSPRALAP